MEKGKFLEVFYLNYDDFPSLDNSEVQHTEDCSSCQPPGYVCPSSSHVQPC